MNDAAVAFVERMGTLWDGFGATRSAGQILGWLMICDPPHQSAAELQEALHLSAGAVSTTVRMLEGLQLVERTSFRGDRTRYVQLREHAWLGVMETRMAGIEQLEAIAAAAEPLRRGGRPDRVDDLAFVTSFMAREWPVLMERLAAELAERKDEA